MIATFTTTRAKLAGAFIALAAVSLPAAPSLAQVEIYNQNGWVVNGTLTGAIGVFGVNGVDFGVGNLDNYRNPLSARRGSRNWFETYLRPGIAGTYSGGFGQFYFAVNAVFASTFGGNGDAFSSLAPQGYGSTTTFHPGYVYVDEAYVGWRSAGLFPGLGPNAIDISGGYQNFVIGDGFIVGGGTLNGWGRGALYMAPRIAFQNTAILRMDIGAIAPVRGALFHLATNTNQTRMNGADQAATSLFGGMIELYESNPAENATPPDFWRVTATYLNLYSADTNPFAPLFFSGAPGHTGTTTTANRDGLQVISLRAGGQFFAFNRDIYLFAEGVYQWNNNTGRRVRAYAFYFEGGYRFSTLPWTPYLSYRYAQFSGDSTPGGGGPTDRSYDPLFFGTGARGMGPGTWIMGEIYGNYMGPPSNLNIHQLNLRVSPTDNFNFGLIYYLADFNDPRQFNLAGTGVRRGAFHEVDIYAEYSPRPWLTITPTLAFLVPRAGYQDIARQSVALNGLPATTATGRTVTLLQVVASIKF